MRFQTTQVVVCIFSPFLIQRLYAPYTIPLLAFFTYLYISEIMTFKYIKHILIPLFYCLEVP